jgi:hypothetical protein
MLIASMPKDLTLATPDELRAACAPNRVEAAVDKYGFQAGCLTVLAAPLLTTAILLALTKLDFAIALTGGLLVFAGVSFLVSRIGSLLQLRRRPFRRELERRLAPTADDELQRFRGPSNASWLAHLSGVALPHGGRRLVCLELSEASPAGSIAVRTQRDFGVSIEQATIISSRRELTSDEAARVVACLRANGAALGELKARVADGLPCQILVASREMASVHRGACNLVGLDEALRQTPTGRIAEMIWALGKTVPEAGPLLVGAASLDGKSITVGTT